MADYFVAISEDGVKFRLNGNGTWEVDIVNESNDSILFRSIDWGVSAAKIKEIEGQVPIYETDDCLLYETHVGGFPVNLIFHLLNRKYHTGIYSFQQKHAEYNDFCLDFESLKELMTIKYGKEKEVKVYWTNDLFRNDFENRGLAIASGHHSIFVKWGDKETDITLQITGDNYEICLMLIYRSIRFQALVKSDLESKKLIGL